METPHSDQRRHPQEPDCQVPFIPPCQGQHAVSHPQCMSRALASLPAIGPPCPYNTAHGAATVASPHHAVGERSVQSGGLVHGAIQHVVDRLWGGRGRRRGAVLAADDEEVGRLGVPQHVLDAGREDAEEGGGREWRAVRAMHRHRLSGIWVPGIIGAPGLTSAPH